MHRWVLAAGFLLAAAAGCALQRTGLAGPDAGDTDVEADADGGCTADGECSDGVACTIDRCDPSSGSCSHTPDSSLCAVGEICDATAGCLVRPCTMDGDCSDGRACSGTEVCGPAQTCVGGIVVDCDDGCAATSDLCTEPAGACIHAPSSELCNGIDDDCNGTCDEGFACCLGATLPCTTSCNSAGAQTCQGACAWGACTPPPEICNGADDDCDGLCDDGFPCCEGNSVDCTTSCGTAGTRTCMPGCVVSACTPPAEVCNGLDDDCDSMIDETFECAMGSTRPCSTRCGSTGADACSAACAWSGICTELAETCNGADDDCNGTCDDGLPCCQGTTGACTTTCGSIGTRLCEVGCSWGTTCAPPPEVCDGVDNDCDLAADNGFACVASLPVACTNACGRAATQSCSAACALGACTAAEICNLCDDDASGGADSGYAIDAGPNFETLRNNNAASNNPSIAYSSADGEFGIVWTEGTELYFAARLASNGNSAQNATAITLAGAVNPTRPRITYIGRSAAAVYGLVWEDRRAGRAQIYATTLTFDGAAAAQTLVSATGTGQQHAPDIAWSETASLLGIVWQDDNDLPDNIHAAAVRLDLTIASADHAIEGTSGLAYRREPAIASDGTGFGVVWRDDVDCVGCPDRVRFARLDANTARIASSVELPGGGAASREASSPAIAWSGPEGGSEWGVAFSYGTFQPWDIVFVPVSSAGVAGAARYVVGPPSATDTVEPRIEGGGELWAFSWTNPTTDEVYFAWYNRDVSMRYGLVQVTSNAPISGQPDLARSITRYGVVWRDEQDGADGDAWFARMLCAGVPFP